MVRHAFDATEASHLQLRMGRIVEVVDKSENGWWRGVIDDDVGWFPATYVKKIDGITRYAALQYPVIPVPLA